MVTESYKKNPKKTQNNSWRKKLTIDIAFMLSKVVVDRKKGIWKCIRQSTTEREETLGVLMRTYGQRTNIATVTQIIILH